MSGEADDVRWWGKRLEEYSHKELVEITRHVIAMLIDTQQRLIMTHQLHREIREAQRTDRNENRT